MSQMTSDINQVHLIGRLGDFPKIHYLAEDKAVCRMRIATNEKLTDPKGNPFVHTEWHTIVVKDYALAEHCHKSLVKGDQIEVWGKIRQITIEKNKYPKKYFEIWTEKINFINTNHSKIQDIHLLNEQYGKSKN